MPGVRLNRDAVSANHESRSRHLLSRGCKNRGHFLPIASRWLEAVRILLGREPLPAPNRHFAKAQADALMKKSGIHLYGASTIWVRTPARCQNIAATPPGQGD